MMLKLIIKCHLLNMHRERLTKNTSWPLILQQSWECFFLIFKIELGYPANCVGVQNSILMSMRPYQRYMYHLGLQNSNNKLTYNTYLNSLIIKHAQEITSKKLNFRWYVGGPKTIIIHGVTSNWFNTNAQT